MELGLDHLLKIVEGQAKIEAKIDGFIASQEAHDAKIEKLESRVDAAEESISDLKAQRRTDMAVVGAVGSIAVTASGMLMWLLQAIGWPAIKAMFVKL